MRINSINSINNQSFNGLWSKTSVDTDIDESMNIPVVKKNCYYHPFQDETDLEIMKIKDSISNAKIVNDPDTRYLITECKICSRAPFTFADYQKYKEIKNGPVMGAKMTAIDKFVSDKYSDCLNPLSQTPARNINLEG